MTAAAFLDRDGVINRKAPEGQYVTEWKAFHFLPGVPEALRGLREQGARLIVITNQRGVARGEMSLTELQHIHELMQEELAAAGAPLDAILACPHDVGVCGCRKPGTDLFRQALERFPDIELHRSVMVGDAMSDLIAGHDMGCRVYLVGARAHRGQLLAEASANGIALAGTADSLPELVAAGGLFDPAPAGLRAT